MMEAILRSVLFRQEQMEMQWDAEFEQQKQLFHINTSTLIDMLPIQPRKKRLRLDDCLPKPSHDKENLVGFRGFLPSRASLKSPKIKALPSRGLAKRDLNTRFCDNDIKDLDLGRTGTTKTVEAQISLRTCGDDGRIQQNSNVLHATNQISIGASIKVEGDEGDLHVSPPTNESPPGEDRKRLHIDQEEGYVRQICNEQNVLPSNDLEKIREHRSHMAVVDHAEKKSKSKQARKVGKAKECAVEVEVEVEFREHSCWDTHLARGNEPENVCNVEVEAVVETCWDGQLMKTEIVSKVAESEFESKGPRRRGRVKGATAVSQVAPRLTRSRARMVDSMLESKPERVTRSKVVGSVVESERDICNEMPNTQVLRKESAQPVVEPRPLCEAEVRGRSSTQIVVGQVEECSRLEKYEPLKEVTVDGLKSRECSHWEGQKAVPCFDADSISVANGLVRRGSSLLDSQEGAFSSRVDSGESNLRIDCCVVGILANVESTSVDRLMVGQHESHPQPQPQPETIDKRLRHRGVASVAGIPPMESPCEEVGLQYGQAHSAFFDAATAEEEAAEDARCLVASGVNASVEVVTEDMTSGGSPIQLGVSGEEMQVSIRGEPCSPARLSSSDGARQRLENNPTLISTITSISETSRMALPNIKETYSTLLSEVIEGTFLRLNKSRDSEGLFVARSQRSSFPSGRTSSVAIPFELSEAGNDASASEVDVPPTAGVLRTSTVAESFVTVRDGSGEHPVGVLNSLTSEIQGSESDDVKCEDFIQANDSRSGLLTRTSALDLVKNPTSEDSFVKNLKNSGISEGETSRMDIGRGQVKSEAVSLVRYSEARAIEEAMQCSLEQEFHPDVTLTLNRWQFRKRLSPRSKARARRWRSDVATNGVEYGRGLSSEAPAASPSRVVSSRDRSREGAAYETFVDTPPVRGVVSPLSVGAAKADDQATFTSQLEQELERIARRSVSSLCNEILSQDLKGGELGVNNVEHDIKESADENGNPTSLPLLQSVYTLSKACQDDMVSARGFLEEGDQQQVNNLIDSAKEIMEQLSSTAVGPQPRTPASNYPAPSNSRFHGHTNLYPDRFKLFITPRASPVPPPTFPLFATSYLSSAAPDVDGEIESISPRMKHTVLETNEEAVSRSPRLDLVLSEPAVRVDEDASLARSLLLTSSKSMTKSDTGNIYLVGEAEIALKCSTSVGSGSKSFTVLDPIQVDLPSDVLPNRIVPRTSTLGRAIPLPAIQNVSSLKSCDSSTQRTIELGTHQYEGPLGLETVIDTEKFSELRSRFYAVSKDYIGTSSAAEDVSNLLDDGPESLIIYATNPPSPIPNLKFSPGYASKELKGACQSVKKSPPSPKDDHFVSGQVGTGIPCSPIFIGNQRDRVHVQRDGTSDSADESGIRSQSLAGRASMLRVKPQCSSNLISAVPSNSNLPRPNLVTSLRSFIPFVQQQLPSAPYPNGKRDVKVKALEAAEGAKRLAEQKEFEKQVRKKAAELAKRDKQERAIQEKLAKLEKAAQEKLRQQEARADRESEEASKRKVVTGSSKSLIVNPTNRQGVTTQNVLLKVKKTHELKLKMDQEKQERLLEEQCRKEDEWRKKEAENAARKRKHEVAEKKEREEKRRRQEEAMKAHREMEERQRSELEKKTQKQRAMEEMEKERKAIEEELKRQKRLDKEREVEQRRRKEEDRELAWLEEKEANRKRKEESARQMKLLETEARQLAVKTRRPSDDLPVPSVLPYHSFMASLHIAMGIGEGTGAHSVVNSVVDPQRISSQSFAGHPLRVMQQSSKTGSSAVAGVSRPCQPGQLAFAGPPGGAIGHGDKGLQSYEISPFRDSEDEDSEEEEKRSQKPIPQWARKENILAQLGRQVEQDPDDIFVGASSCSLDEVFEVKGSKKRPDFKRRGSSGDWSKDCLTWQEQIQHKVTMGYLH